MEIAFESRNQRALVESAKAMQAKFGQDEAAALMTLISDIRAAESIQDVLGLDISPSADKAHGLVISVGTKLQVTIEANHASVPIAHNGSVAWGLVYMIKITDIHYASH